MEPATTETDEYVNVVSDEEAWEIFESETQRLLGMSADEFIEKFDSGYWPDPDAVGRVMYLASVRTFAEPGVCG